MNEEKNGDARRSVAPFDWREALEGSWYALLPTDYEELRRAGVLAELLALVDGASSAVKVRILVEWLVRSVYEDAPGGQGQHVSVGGLLRRKAVSQKLGENLVSSLLRLVDHGNAGACQATRNLTPANSS